MLTAQSAKKAYLAIIVLIVAALVFPRNIGAASGNGPTCQPSTNCTVGEFLYDDSYIPITNASCNLTSYNPNGTVYLNNVALTAASTGWYSYSFTTASTTGLYPTQVCCDTAGQRLCIDKSFNVQAAVSGGTLTLSSTDTNNIAAAVWGYSSRSMTTFGSLASDIWSNAARTLTGAGIPNGSLATQSDVTSSTANLNNKTIGDIASATKENRILLEQMVNKPIIQNFLEQGNPVNLQGKLDDSKKTADKLSINTKSLSDKIALINSSKSTLSDNELSEAFAQLAAILGNSDDSVSKETVLGEVNWIKNSWDWKSIDSTASQTRSVRESLNLVQKSISESNQDKAYPQLKTLAASINNTLSLVGKSSDTSKQNTIYGSLNGVQAQATALNQQSVEINNLLTKLSSGTPADLKTKITQLSKGVLLVNQLPQANSVLGLSTQIGDNTQNPSRRYKNELLAMNGVIKANQQYLANKSSTLLSTTWLEEGSIIFKSLITNPSQIISQTVPIKYYLPPEVKKENVIKTDGGLTIEYDNEKNLYYTSGEINLAPRESKTISIEVDDSVFNISDKMVQSWRDQAAKLVEPLKSTSYYAQGVTLQSDIDASCDRIVNLQKTAVTPDEKISRYKEAVIESNSIKTKMDALKGLSAQASSVGTLFGFIGGTQTLAVWGLIIIMVTGFVFMVLYMKIIRPGGSTGQEVAQQSLSDVVKKVKKVEPVESKHSHSKLRSSFKRFGFMFIMISISYLLGVSSVTLTKAIKPQTEPQTQMQASVLGTSHTTIVPQLPASTPEATSAPEQSPEEVNIIVPEKDTVNVYSQPDSKSTILSQFKASKTVKKIGESTGWIKIPQKVDKGGKTYTEGWIKEEFVSKKSISDAASSAQDSGVEKIATNEVKTTVRVKDTFTGWLNVRETPGGKVIDKINPGESYPVIDQDSSSYRIELKDGKSGWIAKEYATLQQDKNNP